MIHSLRRRAVAMALALCLLLSCAPGLSLMAEPVSGAFAAGAAWRFENGTLTVSGNGATDAYEVRDIGDADKDPLASFRSAVTAVVVEEGVTKLDKCVFYGMESLSQVTLPASLVRIETRVFKNCAALREITIPGTLAFLGLETFVGSGITRINFLADAPSSVSSTKPMTGLAYELHVPAGNTTFTEAKVAALGGEATLMYDGEVGGEETAGACGDNVAWRFEDGTLTLSGAGETQTFTRNASTDTVNTPWAHLETRILRVVVEAGITSLKNYAFYHLTALTSVSLPEGLTEIAYGVFRGCAALKEITQPASLNSVGSYAFADAGLESVVFTGSVPAKGTAHMFSGDALTLLVPCDDPSWGNVDVTPYDGTLVTVLNHTWQDGVCTRCGAQQGIPVTGLTLTPSDLSLSEGETATLTAAITPGNASDPSLSFSSSDETVATVSGSGTVTGRAPGNATITAVTRDGSDLSSTVTVTVSAGRSGVCGDAVRWTFLDGTLTLSGTGETQTFTRNAQTDLANTPWATLRGEIRRVVVEAGITSLKNYAFYRLTALTSVSLPEGLTEIAYGAFRGCAALKEITLPASLSNVGSYAFADAGLEKVVFTGTVPAKGTAHMFSGDALTLFVPCGDDAWKKADMTAYDGSVSLELNHTWQNDVCTSCGARRGLLVEKVLLPSSAVSLFETEKMSLAATVLPSDAGNAALLWTSSDERVVSVSANGYLTGIAPGTATVTATAADGSGAFASCLVTVKQGRGGSCGDNVTWVFRDGVLTISGKGEMKTFSRNAQTDLANTPWAALRGEIRRVVVERGVTAVKNYAFYRCENLTDITLPGTVLEIGYGALAYTTALKRISIPASVQKFGSQVFLGSGLKALTFYGDPPKSFGKNLFDGVRATIYYPCSAPTRAFGPGLTWVKVHAFVQDGDLRLCSRCGALDGIAVTDVILDRKELTLYQYETAQLTVTLAPEDAVYPYVEWRSSDEKVALISQDGLVTAVGPGSANVLAVARDGSGAAAMCKVTVLAGTGGETDGFVWSLVNGRLTISGSGVLGGEDRPWMAFADEITSLTLERGVTGVGDGAFKGLVNLSSLTLPFGLTELGDESFSGTEMLRSVVFPETLKKIGARAFAGSALTEMTYTGSLPDLGAGAFEGVTATAYVPCVVEAKDLGPGVTLVKTHDYQPDGDTERCVVCGEEKPSPSDAASQGSAALWWILGGVLIAAAGGAALLITRSIRRKKVSQ